MANSHKPCAIYYSSFNLGKCLVSYPGTAQEIKMAKVWIGTSGYNYMHWWNGVFYPAEVPQRKWLEYYAGFFDTVELNVSFYRLPKKETFESWYKRTPPDFAFVAKGSRFITHIKRLKDCAEPLKLFFDYAGGLKEKLSLILWQLPPRFKGDPQRLSDFVEELARQNIFNCRHAFEFRDESWLSPAVYDILRENNMALCFADWPFILTDEKGYELVRGQTKTIKAPLTADFVYVRRHGATALYASCYSDEELSEDARQIKKWLSEGKEVYVYFNNDAHGYAVKNALTLKKLLE